MDAAESYSYPGGGELDLEDTFRLVEVQPGERDAPVTVHLLAASLHGCPQYEALSYAWGDATQTEAIHVVALASRGDASSTTTTTTTTTTSLSVTRSCAAALRRLRLPTEPRLLWIDAICIDQSSVPERNHQLSLMPQIYSGAACVVVYLGESSDAEDSDDAMDWLRETQDPWLTSGRQAVPGAISSLLGRPWFLRTWVLQEIQLARRATVVCGTREVGWEALNELRYMIDNNSRAEPLPYAVQSLTDKSGRGRRKTWVPPYPVRLLQLLQNTRYLEATDARNKLYAVLPLLDWEDQQRNLSVDSGDGNHAPFAIPKGDYSRSPAETFAQLGRALIDTLGLNVLCSIVTPTKVPGLPTWAPDWSTHALRSSRGTKGRTHLRKGWAFSDARASSSLVSRGTADGAGDKPWRFSEYMTPEGSQSTQLHVRAATVGTIVQLGELCDVYRDYLPLEQWESICEPRHLGETGPEMLTPFVETLFGTLRPYADMMLEAVQNVKEFHRQGPIGQHDGKATCTDGRALLRHLFVSWTPSYRVQAEQMFSHCHGRKFFVADTGFLGLAPEAAVVGDRVVGIEGLKVPLVARSAGDSDASVLALRLVGQCYAEGALNAAVGYEEAIIR
ncbi:HET-domain-containing protein [Colletotrichum sublineola]|nr:HET-domain-containing protein [Colletotrichum sublineola]